MIFDIPASIGSKRRYLVINGVEIEPFLFPSVGGGYYTPYSSYEAFKVNHLEDSKAITLDIKTEYASDLSSNYIGLCTFDLKELLSTFNENIEDYNNISFLVSCENYDSTMNYSISSQTDIHGVSLNYYDVERKTIKAMGDGDKSIYKLRLKEFYNLDYMLIRFLLQSNNSFYKDTPPKLHIHAIYLE